MSFKTGENGFLFFNKKGLFEVLELLKNKPLKKVFFHPDYEKRINPYIKDIFFTITKHGCHIKMEFSFDCEGYRENSGWIKEFWKKNTSDESLEFFLEQTFKTIDTWLECPQILSRCEVS